MTPKRRSGDAGNSGVPKRSCEVLPFIAKVEVLGFIRKEQNRAEVAKIYGKNESSVRNVEKKEKEIGAGVAVTP